MKRCSTIIGIIGVTMSAATIFFSSLSFADTLTATDSAPLLIGASLSQILVNRDVINNNDDTVGTIDHVAVDPSGRVDYVVIDVSAWLHSNKLISMPWRQLTVDSDGNVRTTMTKDFAKQSISYTFQNDLPHHHVIARMGDLYEFHQRAGEDRTESLSTRD
jgi:hypothetical protein